MIAWQSGCFQKSTRLVTYAFGQVGDGVFEVLSTSGDTHLGGDDFDKRIVDFLAADFQKSEGIDLRKDRQALQRLTEAAEKAKMELSTLTQARACLLKQWLRASYRCAGGRLAHFGVHDYFYLLWALVPQLGVGLKNFGRALLTSLMMERCVI